MVKLFNIACFRTGYYYHIIWWDFFSAPDFFVFYSLVEHAATPVGTPKPTKNEVLDDDEPPLNEDDDDDDDLDDIERGEEEPQTQHLVLAQFDKVKVSYPLTKMC